MNGIWPEVPLNEIARPVMRPIPVVAGESYRTIGVKWWGEGAYERETIDGSRTAAKVLSLVKAGDLIINKIWVRHGSTAIATAAVDGCAASGEFPTFELDLDLVAQEWIHWLTKTPTFWKRCAELSRGTSGKNRIKPELFLTVRIPLPPLSEQRRVLERVQSVANSIEETRARHREMHEQMNTLLMSTYLRIIEGAPRKPMAAVAPLHRRQTIPTENGTYPQVSARSFGRGTFHKPPLATDEITWQKLFLVKRDDILLSNIKAWEGAIAVATAEDDGRYGSHRYLTCVPVSGVATPRFICFHLLTPEGLADIRDASPGSADRNRTLNTKALEKILVPKPSIQKQMWFDDIWRQVHQAQEMRADAQNDLDSLLASVLSQAVNGGA